MLIDRHRLAVLLRLSAIADSSEVEQAAHRDELEALLVAVFAAATPSARERFKKRVEHVPEDSRPWAFVRRPAPTSGIAFGPLAPPVVLLVLGQLDDDPDAAEDGNRLPDRDAKEGAPWQPLYAAIDRWDATIVRRHIGPTGWILPTHKVNASLELGALAEHAPTQPVFTPIKVTPKSPATTPPASSAPTPDVVAAPPANPRKRALLIAGGTAGTAVGGALLYSWLKNRRPTP